MATGLGDAIVVTERSAMGLKVAVADLLAFIVTVHVPVPVQTPLQPPKSKPEAGVAFRVTTVSLL